jgi:hypothetical protein
MGKGVEGSGVNKGEIIRRQALPTLKFIPTDLRVKRPKSKFGTKCMGAGEGLLRHDGYRETS